MKTLKILVKNQGGAVSDDFWDQLNKLPRGRASRY